MFSNAWAGSVSSSGLFSKDAGGLWARVPNLDIDQLNVIVERLLPDFLGHYLRRHRSIYGSLSTSLNEAITSGLRREAQLKEVRGALGVDDLALLDNLLDGHPRAERPGLRGFIPDAFELTYQRDSTTAPSKLHNCFLLTARGGLNSEHCGATLLWTPAQGAEPFETFHAAEVELRRRLHHPVERLSLLENLANDQRPAHPPITPAPRGNHRVYPSLGFTLIHSSLLSNRFRSLTDKALADLNHAATSGYTGKQFQQNLQSCLDSHSTVPMLERAIQAAQNTATHLALPSWLGSVSDSRQFALAALLDRYRQVAATTDDYHRGIPDLRDTARTKLRSLLSRDFPDQRLDPDRIRVWLTPRSSALPVHEELTDFALRHFDDIGQRSIEVSLALGTLPAALTRATVSRPWCRRPPSATTTRCCWPRTWRPTSRTMPIGARCSAGTVTGRACCTRSRNCSAKPCRGPPTASSSTCWRCRTASPGCRSTASTSNCARCNCSVACSPRPTRCAVFT